MFQGADQRVMKALVEDVFRSENGIEPWMSSVRSDLDFLELSRDALCEFYAGRAPEVRGPALLCLVTRFESPGLDRTLKAALSSPDFPTIKCVFLLRHKADAEIQTLKEFEKRVIKEAKGHAKAHKKQREFGRQFRGNAVFLSDIVQLTIEAKIELATETRERCERVIKQCNKGLRAYSRKQKFRAVPRAGSKLEAFLAWEEKSQQMLREREAKERGQ